MAHPPLEKPSWALDEALASEHCAAFIRETLAAAGYERLVIGLSGGIDSAVSAALAVKALGADKVQGVMMPYATSNASSLTDAAAVAAALGISIEKVEITPMADAFLEDVPADARLRRGNVMARCRMIVLYDRSARDGALVLGTGNRTEDLLGYTTMYGDNACALNPLGKLYKTEVRLLAAHLGLPAAVLTKAPSADLWEGQSDEDELGFTYAEVDNLLHHMIDEGLGRKQLASLGYSGEFVDRVQKRVRAMAFKRNPAPVAPFDGRPAAEAADEGPADEGPGYKDGGFH